MDEYLVSNLTPNAACEALGRAGFLCTPSDVRIAARDGRWAVTLRDDCMAWFPASAAGAERLATERRVLRLVSTRCSFRVPELLFESDAFDVRALVPGRCDPGDLFRRCKVDTFLAQQIGQSIGAFLAEQHTRISHAEVGGWLRKCPAWPERPEQIRPRLQCVVDDPHLLQAIERALARYESTPIDESDVVLIHGDVGFHNIAVDPLADRINGIFDYDDAAWADRHHDFKNLLFDIGREDMLEAALRVYEPIVGRTLDRDRIRLYNAASAISHLALRANLAADDAYGGRTLADDLRWVRSVLRIVAIA
jgi:hypothetical protein